MMFIQKRYFFPILLLLVLIIFISDLAYYEDFFQIGNNMMKCSSNKLASQNTIFLHDVQKFEKYYTWEFKFIAAESMREECPVRCHWSKDVKDYCDSKGVLFEGNQLNGVEDLPKIKPMNQKWYFLSQEPIMGITNDSHFMSFFEARPMSYLLDSFAPESPFTVPNWDKLPPITKKTSLIPVASFISNCDVYNAPARTAYLEELMKYIPIDNYGKCLHNKDTGGQLTKFAEKIEILSKYKFYLSFENSNLTDYVTEKLVHGFMSTAVPIYMGAPNIDEFIPHPKSIIRVDQFSSPKALADYLKYLNENEKEYNEYLEWRKLPISELQIPKSKRKRENCRYCNYSWRCRICQSIHGLLD